MMIIIIVVAVVVKVLEYTKQVSSLTSCHHRQNRLDLGKLAGYQSKRIG